MAGSVTEEQLTRQIQEEEMLAGNPLLGGGLGEEGRLMSVEGQEKGRERVKAGSEEGQRR